MEISKGYKQTEVGVIPEDWTLKYLGDIGEVRMCKRIFNYQTKSHGDIPFYKIGTFGKEPDAYISNDLYNTYKQKFSFPVKGSLLISAAGTIGRTIIYDGKPSYFQDSNIVWIDNDEKIIPNNLLFQILQVVKYNTEGGTIQRLYNNILKSTKFICPPLPEQTAIAEALSDMDALIAQTEKLIEKKEAIKQGMMQELLTPKEGWVTKKLGEIASFYKGKGLPKSKLNNYGKYPCIHYGELFTTYNEEILEVFSKTDQTQELAFSKANDVLMPTSDVTPNGLATASCIKYDNVILGGDILIIRTDLSQIDGVFLSYIIKMNREKILKLVTGTTVYHLYGSDMAKFEFSYPNIETQIQTSISLNLIEQQIKLTVIQLQKLKLQKQGMMQALLTGKIRLV